MGTHGLKHADPGTRYCNTVGGETWPGCRRRERGTKCMDCGRGSTYYCLVCGPPKGGKRAWVCKSKGCTEEHKKVASNMFMAWRTSEQSQLLLGRLAV